MATPKSTTPQSLAAIKKLVAFVFQSKDNLTGYLADNKISFFEGVGVASMAIEAVALVKVELPQIKGIKLTAAEIKEVVEYIIGEFSLVKNKALEAQIKKSIAWIQSTRELIEGWKTIK